MNEVVAELDGSDFEDSEAVADLGGDLRVPWNPPFSPGYVQTL